MRDALLALIAAADRGYSVHCGTAGPVIYFGAGRVLFWPEPRGQRHEVLDAGAAVEKFLAADGAEEDRL